MDNQCFLCFFFSWKVQFSKLRNKWVTATSVHNTKSVSNSYFYHYTLVNLNFFDTNKPIHGARTSNYANCNNYYRCIPAIILQHAFRTSAGCENRWADFTCGTNLSYSLPSRSLILNIFHASFCPYPNSLNHNLKFSTRCRPQIPWWLLVTFGSYCLWSIGMGLVTLKECPEAYNELLVVSFFSCLSSSPFLLSCPLVWSES